jgi:hypothetical protein
LSGNATYRVVPRELEPSSRNSAFVGEQLIEGQSGIALVVLLIVLQQPSLLGRRSRRCHLSKFICAIYARPPDEQVGLAASLENVAQNVT